MDKLFEIPTEDNAICINNTYKQFAKKYNLKEDLFKRFIEYVGNEHEEDTLLNLSKLL